MSFAPIGEVIKDVLKRYKIDGDLESYRVFNIWPDIVGEKIAEHANPVKIKNQILYVEVDDPLWLAQIKYIKLDLIEKLHSSIKRDVFRDIKFFLK